MSPPQRALIIVKYPSVTVCQDVDSLETCLTSLTRYQSIKTPIAKFQLCIFTETLRDFPEWLLLRQSVMYLNPKKHAIINYQNCQLVVFATQEKPR
jgi:hypothetical protein